MNGCERIRAVLRGEWADRRPVMLHNFMPAAREAGITMREYREDPRAMARALIEAQERYGCDGILVDVDTVVLAGAIGMPVDFPEDLPARSAGALLQTLEAVDDLKPVDLSQDARVQVWLEGVRLIKEHFGDEVFVRGNCDQAPFSLASAVRGLDAWLLDLTDPDNHERVHRLLAYTLEVTCQFIRLMAATGAHMLSNGDSPAGPDLISPRYYRQFALPYEKRVVECAHGCGLPYALHICGKTNAILDGMLETGADALELDYKTDVRMACVKLSRKAVFIGNIDPSGIVALGSAADVQRARRELCEVFDENPRLIINAGCAIPAGTPAENIRCLVA